MTDCHIFTGLNVTVSTTVVDAPTFTVDSIVLDSRSSNNAECSSVSVNVNPRGFIPDVEDILKPAKGHIFSSIDQAYEFYKHYRKEGGFDTKLGTEKHYCAGSVVPDIKYFHCTRAGKKSEPRYDNHRYDGINVGSNKNGKCKSKVDGIRFIDKGKNVVDSSDSNTDGGLSGVDNSVDVSDSNKRIVKFRRNKSCKTDCLARMTIKKIDGDLFEVYGFVEEHNHPLVSKDDMQFMMGSRELGFTKQQFMLQVGNSNVGPVKAFKLMKELYGGFDNVGVTATDCKNFRRDMNSFVGDRDAQMVVDKLENLEKRCDKFFMDYCQAPDGSLCGLFWADKMAKLNYQRFGDTISFDATFRSNKYRMVFVPFTGIDNHNRSVTFGAGLLSDETADSYKWLLQSFKKAFVVHPQVVVTDQDPSLKLAIEAEFPNARHRLCMWHVMQKLVTKVGLSVCNKNNFRSRFCRIVWSERISVEMFEREWAYIMKEFGLVDHKWLCDLYEMRHRWIPAFLHDEDMSGLMRTTSRSESENRYFNRFTNPDLSLVEFIGHFESAMDIQRYNQKKNDHESRYYRPQFGTGLQIERDAAELFTLNVFYEIQEEIVASIDKCMSISVEQAGSFVKYSIRDFDVKELNDPTQCGDYEVMYQSSDCVISCSCKRYELFGLLCRHIFYVLRLCNVNEFPKEYVLDRWSKSDEKLWVDNSAFSRESSSSACVREIRRIVEDTVDRLVPFSDKLDLYRLELNDLLAKAEADVPVLMRVNKKSTFCSMLGVTEPESVVVKVPRHSSNKGTGSHKRWRNMDELIQNAAESSSNMRTCFVCFKKEGHNARTCPYKDAIMAARAASAANDNPGSSDAVNVPNKRAKRSTRASDVDYRE